MGMMTNTLLLTYHMTKDEKYLTPIRSMARVRLSYLRDRPKNPPAGSAAWCGSKLGGLTDVAAKYKLLTGRSDFDELLARNSSPYVAFRLAGDRRRLVEALRQNAEAMRFNFEGYTSEVRYTDRVLRTPRLFREPLNFAKPDRPVHAPDPMVLYSSVTGDPGGAGYFPFNAIRWFTPPRDIAALVTRAQADGLEAELFHFGKAARSMSAELYLLAPGDYTVTTKPIGQTNGADRKTSRVTVKGPRTRISFSLPARRLCILCVSRN